MEQGRIMAEGMGQRAEGRGHTGYNGDYLLKSPLGDLGAERNQDKSPIGDLGVQAVSPWLVVKTKTKCEKFVRDRIMAMGIDAFVPLQKRTAKYNRKVKVYELPLI